MVIEYSDLPDDLAHAHNPDGSRTFNAASIALHVINVDLVDRLTHSDTALPYHRAEKKVSFIDDEGLHISVEGEAQILNVDNIIICAGQNPVNELADLLVDTGIELHLIGGAKEAGELDAKRAISQGLKLAEKIGMRATTG